MPPAPLSPPWSPRHYDRRHYAHHPQDFSVKTAEAAEEAVRKMTGDENYKFGDYSKRAVAELIQAEEAAVRQVTGDDSYQFG